MKIDIVVPSVGESVREGMVHKWLKQDGEQVETDEVLVELETDKATVEVVAENRGVLNIIKQAGETVTVGEVLATIDDSSLTPECEERASKRALPTSREDSLPECEERASKRALQKAALLSSSKLSPAVRRVVAEQQLDPTQVQGTGKDGRLLKQDVLTASLTPEDEERASKRALPTREDSLPEDEDRASKRALQKAAPLSSSTASLTPEDEERASKRALQKAALLSSSGERRVPMSMLRRRIAERLVAAQNETAMLTTFNEIDLRAVIACRQRYKDAFIRKHDINLGFMGFFCLACTQALQAFPALNAFIENNDVIYHDYVNMGIAVSTPRGLVVPVIKRIETLSLHAIEAHVAAYASKAREGKISLDDMQGGTFTISNGGVFGSLLSTPILNPPQSGILGMHRISKRPVVDDNDQIIVAPMMYVALSYDHRIADGKQAVGFLVRVKELLEDPTRFLLKV